MITPQELQSDFEKNVFELNQDQCKKIIDRLNTKALKEFLGNKNIASKCVSIDGESNFVFMYFYWHRSKICGIQYLIKSDTELFICKELSKLFVKTCFKILRLKAIKHGQNFTDIVDFYTQQIKGYRQWIKEQVKN